jgi:hypothetical protein
MIPVGAVSSRTKHLSSNNRKSFSGFIKPGMEDKVAEYFAFVYEEYPDVLMVKVIVEMTGINISTVTKWIQAGEIKALRACGRYNVPKVYLFEFMTTPRGAFE